MPNVDESILHICNYNRDRTPWHQKNLNVSIFYRCKLNFLHVRPCFTILLMAVDWYTMQLMICSLLHDFEGFAYILARNCIEDGHQDSTHIVVVDMILYSPIDHQKNIGGLESKPIFWGELWQARANLDHQNCSPVGNFSQNRAFIPFFLAISCKSFGLP